MAKSKAEKIADIELQMTQLENQRKKLLQQQKEQERTERKKRLYKRMGLFESLLPGTIQLTDEQFKIFLEQTAAAESGRRLLEELTAQSTATGAVIHAGGTAQTGPRPSPAPARTGPQSGTGVDRAGSAEGAD